jgi:hypothetical protein
MTQYLHDYFTAHAERAISGMKESQQAQSFYRRLLARLERGEDLSAEVPAIARVGTAGATEVIKQAISENETKFDAVWNLPKSVQGIGRQHVSMAREPYEILPRVTMTFTYTCVSGKVTVQALTSGENVSVEFAAPKNKMAAAAAVLELEKALAFALLAAK